MKKIILILILVPIFQSISAKPIERQRAGNWCWAACIQSAVLQAGKGYLSQEEIAAALSGWPQDRPAYISEVVGLCRHFGLRANQAGYPGSPVELYNTLSSGWKIIAFVRPMAGPVGHFILLEGLDAQGNIVMSDPYTGMTYSMLPVQLYYAWHWIDSVIVGV